MMMMMMAVVVTAISYSFWMVIKLSKFREKAVVKLNKENSEAVKSWMNRFRRHDSLSNTFYYEKDVISLLKILNPEIDLRTE